MSSNQIDALNSFQIEDMIPGATCVRWPADAITVPVATDANSKRAVLGPKREQNLKIGMPGVSDVEFVGRVEPHAHRMS